MLHHEPTYVITNATVYTQGTLQPHTTISVEQGIITTVGKHGTAPMKKLKHFDAKGGIVGPGLVDMHLHGAGGFGAIKGAMQENLEGLAMFLAKKGITSFQLALVSDLDLLAEIGKALENSPFLSSYLLGVYLEGPFIAAEKRGGILSSNIKSYDKEYLQKILNIQVGGKSLVTTMTIAPEVHGSEELADILEEHHIVVAYGHSNCTIDELRPRAKNHITHLYNAMSPIDHKRPGLAAMPFVRPFLHTTYELVCDGVHVHPALLDLTIRNFGTERLCIISDAMILAGLGACEGTYVGKKIYSNGKACYYSENDMLIGSAITIDESATRLYHEGLLDKHTFFQVASENPLNALSQTDRGRVEPGYKADLVILSEEMAIREVFKAV